MYRRRLWRAAPALAATGLAFAAASRWFGWPSAVPIGAIAAGAALLAGWPLIPRRDRGVSDGIAAEIDARAGLDGELRSASWFAAHRAGEPWIDFHMARAAARVGALDWTTLYPSVRARTSRAMTVVITAAAIVMSVAGPTRRHVFAGPRVDAGTPAAAAANAGDAVVIPPELQAQLEELLKHADGRNAGAGERTSASAKDLRDLLDLLARVRNAEALDELARAMDANADPAARTAASARDLAALAERAKRAAAAAGEPEVREALEKLATDLSRAAEARAPGEEAQEAAGAAQSRQTEGENAGAGSEMQTLSMQFSKDAAAEGGATLIMMSGTGGAAGDVQPGVGPSSGAPFQPGAGTPMDLTQALRRETVEASADDRGQTVTSDARRKTEQGRAELAFTGGATGTFDRSRASAPPAVPEARRPAVRTYFIRKP